jgi:hypothetical protein
VNPLPSDRPGRKRITLSPEQLEDRTVPSGNVTAVVTRGMLEITGDAQGNQVWVNGLGHGQAVITPMGDTTVNGGHAPVVLGGIAFAYDTHLGTGDDFLLVTNTQGNIGLFADMGPGDDGLAVDYAGHTGTTALYTRAGNDVISLGMDKFTGATVVNTGAGNDQVVAGGTEFGEVLFAGGPGENALSLVGVNFHSRPTTVGFQGVYTTFPPIANGDSATVRHGSSVTIDVAANDVAPGGTLDRSSVRITQQPRHGTVHVNGDGTVTYTADDSTATSDRFAYTIRNASGQVSNAATVSLALRPPRVPGPVPTITTTAANPTNLASIPFTVTFDKDVTGFDASDVTVHGGTVSGFTAVNARTFAFDVTPSVNGGVIVHLAPGAARDAAGRGSAEASKLIASDREAPTVGIREGPSAGPTSITLRVGFSEDVTGFTAADVSVTGGTVSAFTAVSASEYTVTVTPSGADLVRVNVAADVATDVAGNANTAAATFVTLPIRTDAGMLPTTSPPAADDPNWQAMPDGLKVWDVQVGTGPAATANSTLGVFDTGWLLDGTVLDSAHTAGAPASIPLFTMIQGWQEGVPGMQLGGIRRLYIPAALAYGSRGFGPISPNSDLIFEIKLVSVA